MGVNFTGNNNPNNNGGGIPGGLPFNLNGNGSTDPQDYLINYNTKFANSGTILFRDNIIEQTLAVLIGKVKPNALLVGPAGVGKTKIAEDIAYRLASDDDLIPAKLKKHTIYELPLSNIVAGSSFVGQIEEKIQSVIDFIKDPKNKAILFIDEIHQLAGDSQTYSKIAQILKPELARGEIKVIGATTLQEAQDLQNDPAFNRRFSRIIVDEFTQSQTLEILKNGKASYFSHYNNQVLIPDTILPQIVYLADQYRPAGNHRPDTAITLLDRAIAESIVDRQSKILKATKQGNSALATALQQMGTITLSESQVKRTAIKIMTGNSQREPLDMAELNNNLSVIKGQDEILEKLTKIIENTEKNLFPKKKPLTVLMAGSSGVGKTEVTKIIARQLTGIEPIILNMTEYHSAAAINRIIGSPAGYVGSDSHAELPFDPLEANPYQVILLDEFEKGDRSVQRLFMQVFDEGKLRTSKGKEIDFSKSIIIATTNAGQIIKHNRIGFGTDDRSSIMKDNIKSLQNDFDTELLNRFRHIVYFNSLTKEDYMSVLRSIYETEIARIKSEGVRTTLPDILDEDTVLHMADETFIPEFGARPAKQTIETYIENNI